MSRIFTLYVQCAACLFIAVCLFGGRNASAGELEDYMAASERLRVLSLSEKRHQRIPRLSSKEAAPLITALSDQKRFLSRRYRGGDFTRVTNMCVGASTAAQRYIVFDTELLSDQALIEQKKARNLVEFQDEVFGLLAFMYACHGKNTPAMHGFAVAMSSGEPDHLAVEVVVHTKRSIARSYTKILSYMTRSPSVTIANRLKLLRSLSEAAPQFVLILSPAERGDIIKIANAALANVPPEFKGDLQTIAQAMRLAACEGLCQL
jgi:hypothetical protein